MMQGKESGQYKRNPKKMVLVIGDIMLEQHIIGRTKKLECKDSIPVISRYEDRCQLAASAKIAWIIKKMGMYVLLGGVVGKDEAGYSIKKLLKQEGIPLVLGMFSTRPTTVMKTISISDSPILSLVDESLSDIKSGIFQDIVKLITILSDDLSTITICDYGRGVVTCELVSAIIEICSQKDIITIVLNKNTSTNNNMSKYHGAQVIIVDKVVLEILQGDSLVKLCDIESAVKHIVEKTDCSACVVVCEREGTYLFENNNSLLYIPIKKPKKMAMNDTADELFTASLAMTLSKKMTIKQGFRAACNALENKCE